MLTPEHQPATQAISYLRYSSKYQEQGGSVKRQTDSTVEYCKLKNLKLLDTYKDLGVSAFRGKHSTTGSLSRLIKDCESGKIPKGMALIIENFDRLSREEISVALQRVLALLNDYRIEIHTLDDQRIYTPGKIELTELIISIVSMSRAHSESARKSVLVGKAWEHKREAGKAFSRPGKKPMGRHPNWLNWDDVAQVWVPDPIAVKTIKKIFELMTDGDLGRYQTARWLNDHNIPTFTPRTSKWTAAMIKRIATNRSLAGEMTAANSKNKDAEMIPNYYPVIIESEIIDKVGVLMKQRSPGAGRPSTDKHQHAILTGYSYYLGERIHKGQYKQRGKEVVKSTYTIIQDTRNKYLGFSDPIEHLVCKLIAELTDIDLSRDDKSIQIARLKEKIEDSRNAIAQLKAQQNKLVEAIGIADDIPELVNQLQSKRYEENEQKVIIDNFQKEISDHTSSSGIYDKIQIKKLVDAALLQKDNTARKEIQLVISGLVKRIDLGKKVFDLPDHSNPDLVNHAHMIQVSENIKFWCLIELNNENTILGAMTPEGKIARLRWEEEE